MRLYAILKINEQYSMFKGMVQKKGIALSVPFIYDS